MIYKGEPVSEPYHEIIVTVSHASKKSVGDFRHFWSLHVTGFNDEKHCQDCFIGEQEWKTNNKIPTGTPITIPMKGNFFYICGEKTYDDNFHMPLRWKQGSTTTLTTYNGFKFTVENAELVPFTDKFARKKYPEKSEEYLTCRNFQFAAQMYVQQK